MLSIYLLTSDLSSPKIVKDITVHVAQLKMLWELHGGIRSVQFEWAAAPTEAYYIYSQYIGYRIMILDHYVDRPVADVFITGMSLSQSGVSVTCNGFWFRHFDEYYNFDDTTQDSLQGTPAYNPTGQSLQDDGQDFSTWQTTSGDAAYKIYIVNSDNSVTSGFLGAAFTTANTNDSIYVYQNYALSAAGWNGQDPSGLTASSYLVLLCYNYMTTTEIIKDALTNNVPVISTDQTNIQETNTVVGFWEPNIEEGGLYPGDLIDKLASLSDPSSRQWSYWLELPRLDGIYPKKPIAHFEPQTNDGSYDWAVHKHMISRGALTNERNIQELRNKIRIIYRDMDDKALKIHPIRDGATWIEDTDSQSKYWAREAYISAGDLDEDIADQYGNFYLGKFKGALLNRRIRLTGKYILDDLGARYPLWMPIKLSESYFKFVDTTADISLFDTSVGLGLASQASSMEYDYDSNELTVVLDLEDDRLDAILARIDAFR